MILHIYISRFPGVVLFSEIYQVTGPVARFARQIAGQGYIVAAPSSYHDFTGPEPLPYDARGTDLGNGWKVTKVCVNPPPPKSLKNKQHTYNTTRRRALKV